MNKHHYFLAHLIAHDVSMGLFSAHERHAWADGGLDNFPFQRAVGDMTKLAAMMGFDLVPAAKHQGEPPPVTSAPGFDGRAAPKFHSPALNVLEGEVSRANTGGSHEIVTEPCHGLIGGSGSQCRAADLATEPNGDIAGRG